MSDWTVPEDIYEYRLFQIDPIMQSLPRQTEFAARLSPVRLIQLGRRTLEVAINRAIGNPVDLSAARKDWQQVIRLTEAASARLSALINNLAPRSNEVDWDERRCLSYPLASMIAGSRNPAQNALAANRETKKQAMEEAEALVRARAALQSIAANAKVKDRLVAAQNRNVGAQDQNRFVATFAEVWVAITGSLPTSKKSDQFVDLLLAAWTEAKRGKVNFTRSVVRARKDVQSSAAFLRQFGPEWI
jgi:hypothetical protein